jgi:hypothetical protein
MGLKCYATGVGVVRTCGRQAFQELLGGAVGGIAGRDFSELVCTLGQHSGLCVQCAEHEMRPFVSLSKLRQLVCEFLRNNPQKCPRRRRTGSDHGRAATQSRGNLPKISLAAAQGSPRSPACRPQRRTALHGMQSRIDNGNGVSDRSCERLPAKFGARFSNCLAERTQQGEPRVGLRCSEEGMRTPTKLAQICRKPQLAMLYGVGNSGPHIRRQGGDFVGEPRVASLYTGCGHWGEGVTVTATEVLFACGLSRPHQRTAEIAATTVVATAAA